MKHQEGQTIIEAVIALATILIIVTAISIVIVNGLYNSRFIKNQNEANKYAQEGMELVRNLQQNDLETFQGFVNAGVDFCINEETSAIYSDATCTSTINTGGLYNRTITFASNSYECENDNPATAALRVTVAVKWTSSKCPSTNTFCHKSELISCMPYIYPASVP